MLEFYDWLKENFDTDLTFNEVKEIVDSPFKMLKRVMASGKFTPVRFMGFGLFQVYPKKVKYALQDLQKRYESGNLPHNTYIKNYKDFKNFLDEKEKN